MTNRKFQIGDRVYLFGDVVEKETVFKSVKSGFFEVEKGSIQGERIIVDYWAFNQQGFFEDSDSKTRSLYHADEVVEVDGVVRVKGVADYGREALKEEIKQFEANVISNYVDNMQTPKPFRFGDKVNAFGVDGVVVMPISENEDLIMVYFDKEAPYKFLEDGRAESWHKTPSLFHGWLDCDGETK